MLSAFECHTRVARIIAFAANISATVTVQTLSLFTIIGQKPNAY